MPYCFLRSSLKFQGHTAQKNRRFESSLSKITRPVAAIKSLRFALSILSCTVCNWNWNCSCLMIWYTYVIISPLCWWILMTYMPFKRMQHNAVVGSAVALLLWLSWTSCQIRKIVGCVCARNAGKVFPATDFKWNRRLAIPAWIMARPSRTCRDACRDR